MPAVARSATAAPEADAVLVADEPTFDFASPEFAELFAHSDATAFQHPIWLAAFYREMAYAPEVEKVVVTGRDRSTGSLLFVLPLLRRRRMTVSLIEAAHLGVSDYAQPVLRRDWRPGPSLRKRVVEALPAHDVLNIRPIRPEALAAWKQFCEAETQPLDFSAHAVALSAPFERWRAGALEPSFARYLDRKKKRFLKAGKAELVRVTGQSAITEAIQAVADLRRGRFESDILQEPFGKAFYTAVALDGAGGDFARTYTLCLDGQIAAVAFGLTLRGRFYYLLIGADYQHFGKHSPGLIVYDMIIAEWISQGGQVFDFTIGDETFKADFGTSPVPMHALVGIRTLRGRLAVAAYSRIRTIKNRARAAKLGWGGRAVGATGTDRST